MKTCGLPNGVRFSNEYIDGLFNSIRYKYYDPGVLYSVWGWLRIRSRYSTSSFRRRLSRTSLFISSVGTLSLRSGSVHRLYTVFSASLYPLACVIFSCRALPLEHPFTGNPVCAHHYIFPEPTSPDRRAMDSAHVRSHFHRKPGVRVPRALPRRIFSKFHRPGDLSRFRRCVHLHWYIHRKFGVCPRGEFPFRGVCILSR